MVAIDAQIIVVVPSKDLYVTGFAKRGDKMTNGADISSSHWHFVLTKPL